MHRFYYSSLPWEKAFSLTDTEIYHQIVKVFRAEIGDMFCFFNGVDPIDYVYEIEAIEKKCIQFVLKEKLQKEQSKKQIILIEALPNKAQKLEYIIQKWVEIGIDTFVFFPSERSQKLPLSENKKERYEKIAIEALEQSGGNILPSISFEKSFPENLEGNILFFHTGKDNTKLLKEATIMGTGTHILVVWPEGGWSEREVEKFKEKKYTQVYLWSNILRCETVSSVVAFYLKNV